MANSFCSSCVCGVTAHWTVYMYDLRPHGNQKSPLFYYHCLSRNSRIWGEALRLGLESRTNWKEKMIKQSSFSFIRVKMLCNKMLISEEYYFGKKFKIFPQCWSTPFHYLRKFCCIFFRSHIYFYFFLSMINYVSFYVTMLDE